MQSMKRLWLLSVCAVACGCAGSNSSLSAARFAGTYHGTWVNVNDASDAGTSTWTVSSTGAVDGTDTDPGRATTFHVVGQIDAFGNLQSMSTPAGESAASLDGLLQFQSNGDLSGILVWGVAPPLSYRYTFTR